MTADTSLRQRWTHVSVHYAIDVALFILAFAIGIGIRFSGESRLLRMVPLDYYPSIIWGALVFASACYIFGLYTPQVFKQSLLTRALVVLLSLGLAVLLMTGMFYLNFSTRVGRGVMLYSTMIAFLGIMAHHGFILRKLSQFRERIALLVTCEQDEMETKVFDTVWAHCVELVGIICSPDYTPKTGVRVLGDTRRMLAIVKDHGIDRVICTQHGLNRPDLYSEICLLRYAGEVVEPLVNLCEDIYQHVPLELMTPEWLMGASQAPHMLYIKKTKRGFDIAASLLGLLVLGPVMLLGALAVWLTSKGPVFYRQTRAGRFGRPFQLIKLRSMRVDAEKNGAVWAKANDERVTPVGKFLRKYRIDEIPQLINVLRGEMSLVGPRPERPEFVEELAREIPFYKERLMVQPGVTGWAQVNYPYGASIEDARRKLEYDLYYMKHMNIFLDLFILVDTVRIILKGGMSEEEKERLPHYSAATSSATAVESATTTAASHTKT